MGRGVPGCNESAGRVKSATTRPGNRHLKAALGVAALSAARSKDTYYSARYRRIADHRRPDQLRRNKNRRNSTAGMIALVAIEHKMLTDAWHLLINGAFYRDPGADYYTRHQPARTKTKAIKQLETLAYKVTLEPLTKTARAPTVFACPTSRGPSSASRTSRMTITGTSTPARMRAAVEPRKIRRGAANLLEPTTSRSQSSHLSFFSADSSVMPVGDKRFDLGRVRQRPRRNHEVLLGRGHLQLAHLACAVRFGEVLGRHQRQHPDGQTRPHWPA